MRDKKSFYEFPKSLNFEECHNLAKFLAKDLLGNVIVGATGDEGILNLPLAYLSVEYGGDFAAYGSIEFVTGTYSTREKPFVGMLLRSKTRFKKMEDLADQLHKEVTGPYLKFFEQNNIY